MASYDIATIAEAQESLRHHLDAGAEVIRLEAADALDTAGAQLLAAALLASRAAGRPLRLEMPENGAALALWQGLGLCDLHRPDSYACAPETEDCAG